MIITEEDKHNYKQVCRIVTRYTDGRAKLIEPLNKYIKNSEPKPPAPYIEHAIPPGFVYPAEVESFYLRKVRETDKQVILLDGTPALQHASRYLIKNSTANCNKLARQYDDSPSAAEFKRAGGRLLSVLLVDIERVFGGVV